MLCSVAVCASRGARGHSVERTAQHTPVDAGHLKDSAVRLQQGGALHVGLLAPWPALDIQSCSAPVPAVRLLWPMIWLDQHDHEPVPAVPCQSETAITLHSSSFRSIYKCKISLSA